MISYITILYALIGSLGFALFFNIAKRHIIPATLNGTIGWAAYVIMNNVFHGTVFINALVAGLLIAILAENFARIFKAPSSIYHIIGLIPLVPGSNLYYLAEALLSENATRALEQLKALAWNMLGIGAGAAAVLGVIWMTRRIKAGRKEKKAIS